MYAWQNPSDLSNSNPALRNVISTLIANAKTELTIAPSGTSTLAGVEAYSDSLLANGSFYQLNVDPTIANAVYLNSAAIGTGTVLPIDFKISGTTKVRLLSNGNLLVGTTTDNGNLLQVNGNVSATNFIGVVTEATSLAGGTAGQIPYQNSPGVTQFIGVGTGNQVLQGAGTASPIWTNTPTMSGANVTNIPNAGLVHSSLTIGSTNIALGATSTTLAGLSSVTSTTFVGALTGNASTATTATNIAGGTANQIVYNTAAGTTNFVLAPPTGSGTVYLAWDQVTSAWVWNNSSSSGVNSLNTMTGFLVIAGTSNEITVTNTAGTITLSLPSTVDVSTLNVSTLNVTAGGFSYDSSKITMATGTNGEVYVIGPTPPISGTNQGVAAFNFDLNVNFGNNPLSYSPVYNPGVFGFSSFAFNVATSHYDTDGGLVNPALVLYDQGYSVFNSPWNSANPTVTINGAKPNSIMAFGSITGGTGYVPGTYNNVPLTTGGAGFDASALIVVNGSGIVTTVTLQSGGKTYTPGDSLSASNTHLGGSGSGFATTVGTISAQGIALALPTGSLNLGTGGTPAGTSGQVLTSQGAGTNPHWTSIAANVSSLTGTANEVLVNGTSGSAQTGALTLTLPSTINSNTSGNAATATSALSATTANIAIEISGGVAGSLPYQTAASTTAMLAIGSTGNVLTVAGGVPTWAAPASGTVTTIGIVSANGFGGTSSGSPTAPQLTLTTTVNGMIKGNSGTGVISAATSGTDFSAGTSALATGILKSTTTTGALTIAIASDFPTLNQSTTGNALTATTATNVAGGAADSLVYQTGSGATGFVAIGTSGQILTVTGGVPTWQTVSGTGTVTTVSVASANGFTGTVANATTTPAITIATSITGVLKGNGTAISQATVGTDYSVGTSALTTGILKSTTTTGALTIAIASDFPQLNQSTSGNAATATLATTSTNIAGGAADSIPFQTGAGATGFISIGTTGQVLKVVSGAPAWSSESFTMTIQTQAGDNNQYFFTLAANFPFTIDKAYYQTTAGTITANVKINTTGVTSLTALALTSTVANTSATGANTVAAGNSVSVTFSSNSSATYPVVTLQCTRTG